MMMGWGIDGSDSVGRWGGMGYGRLMDWGRKKLVRVDWDVVKGEFGDYGMGQCLT